MKFKTKISAKLKAVFTLSMLDREQKKELFRTAIILTGVCASAALVLSGMNALLSGIIEENTNAPRRAAMERVIPAEDYALLDYELEEAHGVSAVYEAKNGGELSGYCVEVTAADYSGEVNAVVAIGNDGRVIAVEIVSMPDGVGAKVRDVRFLSQFVAKGGKLTAVLSTPKDDTQISAVSGATASSSAVTQCVNHAVEAVSQIVAETAKEATAE